MEYPAIEKALNVIRARLGILSVEKSVSVSGSSTFASNTKIDSTNDSRKHFPWGKLKLIAITQGEELFWLANRTSKSGSLCASSIFNLFITTHPFLIEVIIREE